jgi:hypothetical protein
MDELSNLRRLQQSLDGSNTLGVVTPEMEQELKDVLKKQRALEAEAEEWERTHR